MLMSGTLLAWSRKPRLVQQRKKDLKALKLDLKMKRDRLTSIFILTRHESCVTLSAAGRMATSVGISGGQAGFQDEQTTKDRRGPSSVVFLPNKCLARQAWPPAHKKSS